MQSVPKHDQLEKDEKRDSRLLIELQEKRSWMNRTGGIEQMNKLGGLT